MRRKGTLVCLMALLLTVPVLAQEKQVHVGFKGGLSLMNFSYDPELEVGPDSRLGLALGALLSVNVSPSMSVDGEVLYVQKGAKLDAADGDCSSQDEWKLAYITISPLLRFKVHGESVSPYFLGGIEFGLLMSADHEWDWECNGETEAATDDVKDYFKDTDFGITVGAGLDFPSGKSTFFAEARYSIGLSDISDTGDDEMSQSAEVVVADYEIKNRGFYFLAGVRF
jgi:opacity protein-like surface antigen